MTVSRLMWDKWPSSRITTGRAEGIDFLKWLASHEVPSPSFLGSANVGSMDSSLHLNRSARNTCMGGMYCSAVYYRYLSVVTGTQILPNMVPSHGQSYNVKAVMYCNVSTPTYVAVGIQIHLHSKCGLVCQGGHVP